MNKPKNDKQSLIKTGNIQPTESTFLFYSGPDGKLHIEVVYADETAWLTQKRMAELFNVESNTITYHLGEIFESGELVELATTRKFRVVQNEGSREVSRQVNFYNLDAIISVGYRVNSVQATTFRKWATTVLRDYMIKGFALDDERLKNGTHFGKDYFEELLERIREIRLSERRIYLKITDIFALSSDYDKNSEITKEFFAFIQNKLHYAIAGGTAAEIIHKRANHTRPHMGLATWRYSPDGKILQSDVLVAKNYLSKPELDQLQLAVTAFLDTAELRAKRGIPTTMTKWLSIMDEYLNLNDFPKLITTGKISKKQADEKAITEYTKFRIQQDRDYISDFEKQYKKINKTNTL